MSKDAVVRLADEVSAWNTTERQVNFATDYASPNDSDDGGSRRDVSLAPHAHVTSIKQAQRVGQDDADLLPPMALTPARTTNTSAPPDSAMILQVGSRRRHYWLLWARNITLKTEHLLVLCFYL